MGLSSAIFMRRLVHRWSQTEDVMQMTAYAPSYTQVKGESFGYGALNQNSKTEIQLVGIS